MHDGVLSHKWSKMLLFMAMLRFMRWGVRNISCNFRLTFVCKSQIITRERNGVGWQLPNYSVLVTKQASRPDETLYIICHQICAKIVKDGER